jgi:hypothetical protein
MAEKKIETTTLFGQSVPDKKGFVPPSPPPPPQQKSPVNPKKT